MILDFGQETRMSLETAIGGPVINHGTSLPQSPPCHVKLEKVHCEKAKLQIRPQNGKEKEGKVNKQQKVGDYELR